MKEKLFAIKLNFLVGEFLWRERHHRGLSRAEVSFYSKIPEDHLLAYEKGVTAIPVNLLCKLADLYSVEKAELHYFLETISARARQPWGYQEYSQLILHRQKVL